MLTTWLSFLKLGAARSMDCSLSRSVVLLCLSLLAPLPLCGRALLESHGQVEDCARLWDRKVSDYERRVEVRKDAELHSDLPRRRLWDPWEPEWNCDIEERVGQPAWGDGAKFVCNPQQTLSKNCLVYSFVKH